jgi:preprotein translocase subunit SecA
MLLGLAVRKIFGSKNDRDLKRMIPVVAKINALGPRYMKMSDPELQAQTALFQQRHANGESLDSLLVEAFAVCREAGARVLGMRHFDVQLIGGMALHEGKIAEMKTGEGKTLVATLPCYLNGLAGRGVHVVTVNDYLAKRDSDWMGRIHRFLGLEVGCILNSMSDTQRKIQYGSHITYGTNNEFGFDYLRDNMKPTLDLYVQRPHNFAIVDEVDSILIDEARTPLIISGPSDQSADHYHTADRVVRLLKKDIDYTIDEKHRNATLTEDGVHRIEKSLNLDNLYAPDNLELVHHVHASLKAHTVFKKDIDYVVREGKVVIVDEFTGRQMPGRRWSDGLHQAIEAKEGVDLEAENQTLATITLQNYFRIYKKLGGMTGTADTEAAEFKKIYSLDVLVVPPNRPMVRKDSNDLVFRNEAGKYRAVIEDIKEKHAAGRPVLVGTTSVAKSERVSKLLTRLNIPHNVLNAKNHEREAEIIATAGLKGGVTIATNMAGRGTDILLGAGIAGFGGLHVIGTERHESRRIDNQLRGRAGRQGDPGSSQFYLSLEDDLMRIFANDKVIAIMDRLGMEEDVPISDRLVTNSIASAQKRVEMHHFDQREHLLKYDNVLNKQREVIYDWRHRILEGSDLKGLIRDFVSDFVSDICSTYVLPTTPKAEWDLKGFSDAVQRSFGISIQDDFWSKAESSSSPKMDSIREQLTLKVEEAYSKKQEELGPDRMVELEKYFLLRSVDHHWKEHLLAIDHVKEGIYLRGYAQKDPLVEYQKEAFHMFQLLTKVIRQSALTDLFNVRLLSREEQEQQQRLRETEQLERAGRMKLSGPSLDAAAGSSEAPLDEGAKDKVPPSVDKGVAAAMSFLKNYQNQKLKQLESSQRSRSDGDTPEGAQPVKAKEKPGRNDPCHCGSGKKYKHCHGQAES